VLAPLEMDRPILAPPGVSAERVAALRVAFHAAMNDPAFIAQAEKENLEIGEVSGSDVAQILNEAFALSPDVPKAAATAIGGNRSGGE
jgi:tripartite-type tricarboxylate transporter receptor subunit TctC